MRSFNILSSLLWTAATAAALPQAASTYDDIPDGYSLANLTWTGTITPNGPEASFTGASFQDIEAQIRQANPDFVWPDRNATDLSLPDKEVRHLSCNLPQYYYAKKYYIDEGISYLGGVSGQCHIEAGPKVCTRISCSYDSAIFWCNDRNGPLSMDCSLGAQFAQNIVDQCATDDMDRHVKGQQFSTGDWNIVVGYSKC